jgi:hypothetical protein
LPRPSKIGQNKREVAFVRDLFDHQKDLSGDPGSNTSRPLNQDKIDIEATNGRTISEEMVSAENTPLQKHNY